MRLLNLQSVWTRSHGFFAIMGGFYVYDGETPIHPLVLFDSDSIGFGQSRTLTISTRLISLVETRALIPPSEAEIKDKSKGDAFAKAVVLAQTIWFVAQCVARWYNNLPIAELEIVTLAYTTVICGMYVVWWDKPLNVDQPVRVPRHLVPSSSSYKVRHRSLWGEVVLILKQGLALMFGGEFQRLKF